jgi:hypothetical protein
MPERKWVSCREAGEFFGIPAKTFYSLVARGRLPAGSVLKIGRAIRINISVIEQAAPAKERQRP